MINLFQDYHSLVKNDKGGGGRREGGGLISFLPLKRGAYLREGALYSVILHFLRFE